MTADHRMLTALLFGVTVVVTLAVTGWAARGRADTRAEFFAGGRLFSPLENGLALAGGYLSAASFFGVVGLVALYGYDGVIYSVGFVVGWPVLLLLAERVRSCGRFTLADAVTARMRARPVRAAAGVASLTVSLFCLVALMAGAGSLVALLTGGDGTARAGTVIGIGFLTVVHVCCGGMRATTWIQISKAVLLLGGVLALTVTLLLRFEGDLDALLSAAAERSGHGAEFLAPGLQHGDGWADRLDVISLGAALALGTVGMPHVIARLGTVPTARAARASVTWSVWLIGGFHLMTVLLGFGAAALVGPDAVSNAHVSGNAAVPLLSQELAGGAQSASGPLLSAVVAAVAVMTILALVAGITHAASTTVAHDLYASLCTPGKRVSEGREVGVARLATVGVVSVAVGPALAVRELNIAFLGGLALAVAASANLPVLLYALFWRRFTTRGAVWSVYGGLVPAVLLVLLSPTVSGSSGALFPGVDFAVFPLENPGLLSIPLGFAAGWAGTVSSHASADDAGYAETEVRALTGAGAA